MPGSNLGPLFAFISAKHLIKSEETEATGHGE